MLSDAGMNKLFCAYASPCQADDTTIGEKLEDIGRQRKVMECHKKGCEQAKLRYESMLGS